ncbi:MAG: hypothetical protein HRU28_12880, partial [Rhizobiales bacterium]|nr:hypothetical protein [Hyphomicrobiales bacterium]
MPANDPEFKLPSRDEILNILQDIKNPFTEGAQESIVDAGFITAPLSRLIDNKPQIGLILDIKSKDEAAGKALETAIEKLLIDKTSVEIVQFLKPKGLKGKAHNLILNNGIKNISDRPKTGHTPFGGVGGVAKSDTL